MASSAARVALPEAGFDASTSTSTSNGAAPRGGIVREKIRSSQRRRYQRVFSTVAKDEYTRLRAEEGAAGKVSTHFAKYVSDPVAFCENELQALEDAVPLKPWARQVELLMAVVHFARVLCRSGHRCGKTMSCIILALWWVSTRPKARVVLLAPTYRQVKDVLWKQLSFLYPRVRAKLGGPELPKDPATGLTLPNGSQIIGLSTKDPEKIAGYAGVDVLFIIDEASGFPDVLFSTIRGNSAGGAKIVAISNPTRTFGWFFDGFKTGTYDLAPPANDNAFTAKDLAELTEIGDADATGSSPWRWRCLHISSEHSPNLAPANDNDQIIPGLATPMWIAEMREACGPDYMSSAEYLVRVLGQFPTTSTDSVIDLGLVLAAHKRHGKINPNDLGDNDSIGVDVAGFGNDESIIQPVRGWYAYPAKAFSKMDGAALAEEVVKVARQMRRPRKVIRVCVDGIGIGQGLLVALRLHPEMQRGYIELVDVQVGAAADDAHHANLRAQLYFGVRAWLLAGGALPEDDQLENELKAHTYSFNVRGQKLVIAKKIVRAVLGRSPDRADALALALYSGRGAVYDGAVVGDDKGSSSDDDDDETWSLAGSGGRWA